MALGGFLRNSTTEACSDGGEILTAMPCCYTKAVMLPKISTNKLAIFLFCFCLRENIEVTRRLVAVRTAHYTASGNNAFCQFSYLNTVVFYRNESVL